MRCPTGPKASRGVGNGSSPGGAADDSAPSAAAHQGDRAHDAARRPMPRDGDFPAGIPSNLSTAARRVYAVAIQRYGEAWLARYGAPEAAEQWNQAIAPLTAAETRGAWYALLRQACSVMPSPDEFVAMARSRLRRRAPSPEALERGRAAFAECRAILAKAGAPPR